jgi:hypothetical protein
LADAEKSEEATRKHFDYEEPRKKSCVCIKICIVIYSVGIVAPACRISDIDPTIGSQPPVATEGSSAPCNYA